MLEDTTAAETSLRKKALVAAIGANSLRLLGCEQEYLDEISVGIPVCEALSSEVPINRSEPPDDDAEYRTWCVLRNVISQSPRAAQLPDLRIEAKSVLSFLRRLKSSQAVADSDLIQIEDFFRQAALLLEQ